ncbi:hypothetical protein JG677_01735 [Campylobacter sp. TTU-622]|nr:hypothetical protein [Campylobacter sp. TTU_617]MBK1972789.1 hypothetical protein [Campylobacter sp. TTU-622]
MLSLSLDLVKPSKIQPLVSLSVLPQCIRMCLSKGTSLLKILIMLSSSFKTLTPATSFLPLSLKLEVLCLLRL